MHNLIDISYLMVNLEEYQMMKKIFKLHGVTMAVYIVKEWLN